MKTKIKTLLTIAVPLLFLIPAAYAQVTSPPTTQQERDYTDWDSNNDELIDNEEFRSAFGEKGYYGTWDSNTDNQLDEDEWNTGVSTNYSHYNDVDYGMFGDWDNDGDSYINEDEFSDRTFNLWDEDGDGYITEDEYNTWNYNAPE